jgi:hypothetical protein
MRPSDARLEHRDLPLRIEVLLGWNALRIHCGLPMYEQL